MRLMSQEEAQLVLALGTVVLLWGSVIGLVCLIGGLFVA